MEDQGNGEFGNGNLQVKHVVQAFGLTSAHLQSIAEAARGAQVAAAVVQEAVRPYAVDLNRIIAQQQQLMAPILAAASEFQAWAHRNEAVIRSFAQAIEAQQAFIARTVREQEAALQYASASARQLESKIREQAIDAVVEELCSEYLRTRAVTGEEGPSNQEVLNVIERGVWQQRLEATILAVVLSLLAPEFQIAHDLLKARLLALVEVLSSEIDPEGGSLPDDLQQAVDSVRQDVLEEEGAKCIGADAVENHQDEGSKGR